MLDINLSTKANLANERRCPRLQRGRQHLRETLTGGGKRLLKGLKGKIKIRKTVKGADDNAYKGRTDDIDEISKVPQQAAQISPLLQLQLVQISSPEKNPTTAIFSSTMSLPTQLNATISQPSSSQLSVTSATSMASTLKSTKMSAASSSETRPRQDYNDGGHSIAGKGNPPELVQLVEHNDRRAVWTMFWQYAVLMMPPYLTGRMEEHMDGAGRNFG